MDRLGAAGWAIRSAVVRFGRSVASQFDTRDVTGIIGLALLGYGLSLVWLPLAFVVPGAVIVYVAIFGVKADGHSSED